TPTSSGASGSSPGRTADSARSPGPRASIRGSLSRSFVRSWRARSAPPDASGAARRVALTVNQPYITLGIRAKRLSSAYLCSPARGRDARVRRRAMIKPPLLLTWPLAAAVGAAVAAPAYAQPAVEEVVVTGRRLEETIPPELDRFGNRLESVDRASIDLGGFNDLSQTLQMQVPAFYVAPKNGPFDYMNCSLQGSRCEDVLFLVDGVRIANRLYNTTTPLDTIPAHTIDRIEVLYG